MKPILIGFAGGSGSGKSTLVDALVSSMGEQCVHVVHDRYYRSLTVEQRMDVSAVNFDHPNALDTEQLVLDLHSMMTEGGARLPVYDFKTHRRTHEEWVATRPFVLVEGILVFTHTALCEALDVRIFIETPEHVRLQRRTQRDVATRGRTQAEVTERFWETVAPMHDAFVAPTKDNAHLVLDGTAPIADGVEVVTRFIQGLALGFRR